MLGNNIRVVDEDYVNFYLPNQLLLMFITRRHLTEETSIGRRTTEEDFGLVGDECVFSVCERLGIQSPWDNGVP